MIGYEKLFTVNRQIVYCINPRMASKTPDVIGANGLKLLIQDSSHCNNIGGEKLSQDSNIYLKVETFRLVKVIFVHIIDTKYSLAPLLNEDLRILYKVLPT